MVKLLEALLLVLSSDLLCPAWCRAERSKNAIWAVEYAQNDGAEILLKSIDVCCCFISKTTNSSTTCAVCSWRKQWETVNKYNRNKKIISTLEWVLSLAFEQKILIPRSVISQKGSLAAYVKKTYVSLLSKFFSFLATSLKLIPQTIFLPARELAAGDTKESYGLTSPNSID